MAKIIQIIDNFHDDTLSHRICEVIGVFSNLFYSPENKLIVGSNTLLSWELSDWLSENKEKAHIEKTHLKYGRVLVKGDTYEIVRYRIWVK